MDERAARAVLMVQALESTLGPDGRDWSRDDRAWAQRSALQAVGADAGAEAYVASRAEAALRRLRERLRWLPRWLDRGAWHGRWVALLALAAFVAGALADGLGAGQRVNLLAPAVWGVLAWNAAVYLALLAGALMRRPPSRRGAFARALDALRERLVVEGGRSARAVLRAYAAAWLRVGARLRRARAALLLHGAAAALALGLIAGMYLRGLVLDYQASWQSTFLDAAQVHALLHAVLGPAAALLGQPLPGLEELAALRAPEGSAGAAPWIHLLATTLGLAVVLPRLLLAGVAWWQARRRAAQLELPLHSDPYFVQLLQQQRGGRTQVRVMPYAKVPSAAAALGLRTVLAEVWGDAVGVEIGATTAFGEEDEVTPPADATQPVIALYDLAATPEEENHGRFAQRLGGAVVAVVDEAAFRRRFGSAAGERIAQRRDAWRRLAALQRRAPVFVDLDAPNLAEAAAALRSAWAVPHPS